MGGGEGGELGERVLDFTLNLYIKCKIHLIIYLFVYSLRKKVYLC